MHRSKVVTQEFGSLHVSSTYIRTLSWICSKLRPLWYSNVTWSCSIHPFLLVALWFLQPALAVISPSVVGLSRGEHIGGYPTLRVPHHSLELVGAEVTPCLCGAISSCNPRWLEERAFSPRWVRDPVPGGESLRAVLPPTLLSTSSLVLTLITLTWTPSNLLT